MNTERRIEQQFQASHVGQLTQRHEADKISRQTQANIPSQGSTREVSSSDNQSSN